MSGVTTNISHVGARLSQNEMRKRAFGTSVAEALSQAVKSHSWPVEAVSYAQVHLMEVKRVLDDANLVPIASEETIVATINGKRVTGRIDLICEDQDGHMVILDIKTYGGVGETERAQVSLYAYMMKERGTPVTAAGLLVVPTTGTQLVGYIKWMEPMKLKEACQTLNIRTGDAA